MSAGRVAYLKTYYHYLLKQPAGNSKYLIGTKDKSMKVITTPV